MVVSRKALYSIVKASGSSQMVDPDALTMEESALLRLGELDNETGSERTLQPPSHLSEGKLDRTLQALEESRMANKPVSVKAGAGNLP